MNQKQISIFQFYLRLSIGVGYVVFGLDRFGIWGKPGDKNVSWGNWQQFVLYAEKVMSFLPSSLADILAAIATAGEIGFGVLLIIGKFTRAAAIGSGILSFFFALSMAISFGIVSPLSYSVFTLSAASFLLSTVSNYKWSLDALSKK